MCGWQVKLYDPIVTHRPLSERFRDKGLITKRYIHSFVYFTLLTILAMNIFLRVNVSIGHRNIQTRS